MDNYEKYNLKYDNIESSLSSNDLNNQNDILSNLKDDLDDINQYKSLVNKSKALMIKLNKSNNLLKNKKNIEDYINSKINILTSSDLITFEKIIKNYKDYLNIDYDKLNHKIEKIIYKNQTFNHLDFYYIINYKKNKKNNLQKLITSINFKNCYNFFPKILFLNNPNCLESYESISKFVNKLNFKYHSLSTKILKRGFLFEVTENNINYILKFQPNKSFMEILINKYLSKYHYLNQFILYPKYFFVNKNNSYFYIIKKYNYDLFSYIKQHKEPLENDEILFIIKFIIQFIYHLHELNIIYADIKLENIIVNIQDNKIFDMKFIDFDVSLFDELPEEFLDFDPKILKLLNNKKPRGTKLYQSPNKSMNKSNDIYSIGTFIIILLYKNTIKVLYDNKEILSKTLLSKILNRLSYLKNKLDDDDYKKKLIKYMFRIYNDKRFRKYWNNSIKIKDIYLNVKRCIDHNITINELNTIFN